MNALAESLRPVFPSAGARPRYRMANTTMGFNISETRTATYDRTFVAEAALKIVGIVMVPAAGIVLFLPGIDTTSTYLTAQAALISAFAIVGFALHRYANRGFLSQVRIDTTRGEIRTGTCNTNGDFHHQHTYPVNQIESFFIARSKNAGVPAKLRMRLKTGTNTICLAEGSEDALIPMLERITLALKPPKMQNRRVRTEMTGQFIRMSFD